MHLSLSSLTIRPLSLATAALLYQGTSSFAMEAQEKEFEDLTTPPQNSRLESTPSAHGTSESPAPNEFEQETNHTIEELKAVCKPTTWIKISGNLPAVLAPTPPSFFPSTNYTISVPIYDSLGITHVLAGLWGQTSVAGPTPQWTLTWNHCIMNCVGSVEGYLTNNTIVVDFDNQGNIASVNPDVRQEGSAMRIDWILPPAAPSNIRMILNLTSLGREQHYKIYEKTSNGSLELPR